MFAKMSAMNVRQIAVVCFAILLLGACRKDDNSVPSLVGAWQEQETKGGIQFAGSSYRISFFADGHFDVSIGLFTDALDPRNPCNNPRTQYARGSYTVDGNTLALIGKYCDSSYRQPLPDCRYGENFEQSHTLGGHNGDLILDPEKDQFRRIYLVRQ
jgi:hypothetical protein